MSLVTVDRKAIALASMGAAVALVILKLAKVAKRKQRALLAKPKDPLEVEQELIRRQDKVKSPGSFGLHLRAAVYAFLAVIVHST